MLRLGMHAKYFIKSWHFVLSNLHSDDRFSVTVDVDRFFGKYGPDRNVREPVVLERGYFGNLTSGMLRLR